ncbi:MAG TPA: hypothetical protein ENH21_02770 [Chromatiales bacterium]|nr:hypothetical protein [Chromatiales bacterium]HEX22334.1 hypothetical protein [Chromatiales bacterium]
MGFYELAGAASNLNKQSHCKLTGYFWHPVTLANAYMDNGMDAKTEAGADKRPTGFRHAPE